MSSFVKVSYESSDSEEASHESDGDINDGQISNDESSGGSPNEEDDVELSDSDSISGLISDADDAEGSSDDTESKGEKVQEKPGAGLANVMAKILGKQIKDNKIILAKAKTEKELRQSQKRKNEEIGEESSEPKKLHENDEKTKLNTGEDVEVKEEKTEFELRQEKIDKKKKWENMARSKPVITERERERALQKIATRGVVQLFNAVQKQQKQTVQKLSEVGNSIRKRDKVLEEVDKGKFMDVLKETKVNTTAEGDKKGKSKDSNKKGSNEPEKTEPSWSILKEDYMMGSKMKDWDKESDSEGGGEEDMEAEEESD